MKYGRCAFLVIFLLQFTDIKAQPKDLIGPLRKSQSSIGLQWEVPVQLGLRVDYNVSSRFSVNIQAGLLRKPNSTMILSTLNTLGVDDLTIDLIESAFESGYVVEEGINYHFKNNHVGVFLSQVFLSGSDTPSDVTALVFDQDFNTFPRRPGRNNATVIDSFLLKSNLFQIGVQYGRMFPLSNGFTILMEIGVSANLGSMNSLDSDQLDLTRLDAQADAFFRDLYSNYAFIPSLTVGIQKEL